MIGRRRTLQQIAAHHRTTKNKPRAGGKWPSVAEVYEPFVAPLRGSARSVLEIGIERGGSLKMWAAYFRRAQVWGVDRRDSYLEQARGRINVLVGDQGDAEFRAEIARKGGPFDLVVDDGSHQFDHQRDTLLDLWPHVRPGGVYIVEDVHTSYRPAKYGGGLGVEGTFMEWAKGLVDDVHHKVHREEPTLSDLASMHVLFQSVVLCKWEVPFENRPAPYA